MEFVVDANILIAAIIASQGKTRDLVFSEKISLFAPEYLLEEIKKHNEEIISKSRLSKKEFELALSLISSRVKLVPFSDFKKFISQAKQITPDINDTEYLALALKYGLPIWSNDKELKEKQDVVKVYNSKEIMKMR